MADAIKAAYEAAQAQFPALTLEMTQAVIEAYEAAHKPVYLTHIEKGEIADAIVYWNAGGKDVVNDVFEEIAKRFIVRRRG
jgi:hypothetical protein